MRRRTYLLILGLLAVTSMTWAAAPPPAMDAAGKLAPQCDCNEDWQCPSSSCGFEDCIPANGNFFLCD